MATVHLISRCWKSRHKMYVPPLSVCHVSDMKRYHFGRFRTGKSRAVHLTDADRRRNKQDGAYPTSDMKKLYGVL